MFDEVTSSGTSGKSENSHALVWNSLQKTELTVPKEQAGRPVWPEQNERNVKWKKIRLERCEALQVY